MDLNSNHGSTDSVSEPDRSSQKSSELWNGGYNVEANVVSCRKVGEGMNSFIVYVVHSKIDLPEFTGEIDVERRFSDFIGLYDRLYEKLVHYGYFIPLPPEKDITSSQKGENFSFLVRRKASLEQFLRLLTSHHYFHKDSLLIEFLTKPEPLPKTPKAVSGAGIFKLMARVYSAAELKRFREPEPDNWFIESLAEVTSAEPDVKALYHHLSHMAGFRRELSESLEASGAAVALFSKEDETSPVGNILSSLSQTEHDLSRICEDQFSSDVYLAENYNAYIGLIEAIKKAFNERILLFKALISANSNLSKKTDLLSKAETLNRLDKLEKARDELEEAKTVANAAQKQFDFISSNIKTEMEIFHRMRVHFFTRVIQEYLESSLVNQTKITALWESFQEVVDSA